MPLTLLLRCGDLNETRRFYESVLGFNAFDSAEGTLTVEKEGGKLVFTPADLWQGPAGFSGTIYFTLTDVDRYFTSIEDKIDAAWPLQDTSYASREFGIKDCNGYHLGFQQQVKQFIQADA